MSRQDNLRLSSCALLHKLLTKPYMDVTLWWLLSVLEDWVTLAKLVA